MEFFTSFGIFLAGLGVLLLGCGLMWFISIYSEKNKQSKQKEGK